MSKTVIWKLVAIVLLTAYVTAFNYGGCGIGSDKTTANGSSGLLIISPSHLVATAISSSEVNLNWHDNSNNEDGFKIERSTNQIVFTEIATVPVNIASYSDTGLIDGNTYYYRVRTFNARGNSVYSDTISVMLPLATPTNLSATTDSASVIKLTWVDNSSSEDGFIIERKTGVDGTYAFIVSVLANITAYTNTGLSSLTTYYYRIKAYNGDGVSPYSNEPYSTTLFNPPAQVTSPTPVDGATNISITAQLSWTSAVDAASYDVYFSAEGGSASGGGIPTSWTPVTNTVLTSYALSSLLYATTYYWRIDSKNSSGVTPGVVWSFTTALSTTASANWTLRSPANKPSPRSSYAMSYDSKRNKTVLFGGNTGSGWSDETWEWNGADWTLMSPINKPTGRGENTMAYDSARERMVMFGGLGDVGLGDGTNDQTWEWDGTNWTLMTTAITPSDRCRYAMAYDASRGKTIMFGGVSVVDNVYTITETNTTYTIRNLHLSHGFWE